MVQKILVFYFVREYSINAIAKLLSLSQYEVSKEINLFMKPSLQEKFIIIPSKMNVL